MIEIALGLLKIFPVILLIGLGVWLRVRGFVSAGVILGIKKIVMGIALPALLFVTFLRTELKSEVFLLTVVVFIASSVAFGMGFLFRKIQKISNPFYPSLFTTYLTGPIGFPLFIAYFGPENFYSMAILDVGNSLFLFTVLTVFLSTVSCDMKSIPKQSFSIHLKNMAKAPLAVSTFLGIALSIMGVGTGIANNPVGAAVLEAAVLLGGVAVPMMLLVVGFELPFDFSHCKSIVLAVALRMTMMLILAYLINVFVIERWLGLDEIYTAALFTTFILPPPFVIPLSIVGECDHKKYVLNFVSLHLFASMIVFAVVMAFIWPTV
jgi:hypothetical protein